VSLFHNYSSFCANVLVYFLLLFMVQKCSESTFSFIHKCSRVNFAIPVQCNKIAALDSFHRQIFEGPTKIGIIGSGCSVSTEPTASISHYYNLVQISCIASSPAFRDRKLFPRYFQLLPTDASLAITYMGLIEFYQWKRVAIIVQMENLFTVVCVGYMDCPWLG
jgi:hypothetical protein